LWKVIDSGWSDWDLEASLDPWTGVRVCTAQEDHGSGRRLIRLRYRLRTGGLIRGGLGVAAIAGPVAALLGNWPAVIVSAWLFVFALAVWRRGACLGAWVVSAFDEVAHEMGLIRLDGAPAEGGRQGPEPARPPQPRPDAAALTADACDPA
jgi:hypothetical protein